MLVNGNTIISARISGLTNVDKKMSGLSSNPVQNSDIANNVSNALRGEKAGNSIYMNDLSPIEHKLNIRLANAHARGSGIYSEPLTFSGINKCFVACVDNIGMESYYGVSIHINNGEFFHFGGTFESYEGIYFPRATCSINGTNLLVNYECYDANGKFILKSTVSFVVPEGSLITGVGTYGEISNIYSVDYLEFPDVKIKSYKKQLLPLMNPGKVRVNPEDDAYFERTPEGETVFNGTTTKKQYIRACNPITIPAGVYTLSGTPSFLSLADEKCFIWIRDKNNLDNIFARDYGEGATFELQEETTVEAFIYLVPGIYSDCYFTPQLEAGSRKTDFEQPEEYSVDTDGSVVVPSAYPGQMLTTNNQNIIIDCEYSRDLNKAFQEIRDAIISIGGII